MKLSAEVFLYLVMGILTTIVNIVCFFVLIQFQMDYKLATTIAWIVSVIFAYITNKIYVFKSKTESTKALIREVLSFFWFRLLSYFVDLGSMILMVGFLKTNETISKIIANVFVVVINYGFSKWFIFKRREPLRKKSH